MQNSHKFLFLGVYLTYLESQKSETKQYRESEFVLGFSDGKRKEKKVKVEIEKLTAIVKFGSKDDRKEQENGEEKKEDVIERASSVHDVVDDRSWNGRSKTKGVKMKTEEISTTRD